MANRRQQRNTSNPGYAQDQVMQVIQGYARPGGSPNLRTGNDEWSRPRVVSVQEYAVGNKQPKQ